MKLKCIENHANQTSVAIALGDVLTGVAVPGSQGFDIVDKNGVEWFVEPYLGNYAILSGGSNFTTMQVVARFEEVVQKPNKSTRKAIKQLDKGKGKRLKNIEDLFNK